MKNSSKNIFSLLGAFLLALQIILVTIQPVRAANNDAIPAAPMFCASINSIGSRIEAKLNSVSNETLPTIYDPASLKSHQEDIKKELAEKRIGWDEARNQQYEKMFSLAQSDAQKTAIQAFKISVEDAILIRRVSVDTAIDTYYSQTGTDLETKSKQLSQTREDFTTAIKSTISTAQSDCQTNKSPNEIRTNFQKSIETARTQLQDSQQSIGDFKKYLETVHQDEVQSINDAVKTFQTSVSKARQMLIIELNRSGANTSQFDI